MTASISPQVRIVALVGLLAAAGLAVWTFALAHRRAAAPALPVAAAHPAPAPPAARPKPLLLRLDPSLPAPLLHALRYSRVVVAAIYLPGDARDRQALLAARQGARDARVGFAALVVAAERVAAAIAALAREKQIEKVVFNRNGFLYHGRVKAVADAAREAGLQF